MLTILVSGFQLQPRGRTRDRILVWIDIRVPGSSTWRLSSRFADPLGPSPGFELFRDLEEDTVR